MEVAMCFRTEERKVTKQTVAATRAELEMAAKDAGGQTLTGTATLVKEGSAWKVDDFAWAGPRRRSEAEE